MQNSNLQVQIREATLADVPELCSLLSILFAQESDFTPDTQRQIRALQLIIESPQVGRIYCATQNDAVVGMVSILFTVSTAEGGLAAWLEDMVVNPEWRGRQIGELLLKTATEQARAAGCTRLTLLTDTGNDRAIRFYQRAGFARSSMTPLRLKL